MKTLYVISLLVLAGLNICLLVLTVSTKPSIAYIRSGVILADYEGMKEVRDALDDKKELWHSNVDTLESDFRRALHQYNSDFKEMSGDDRRRREEYLDLQQRNLNDYRRSLERKARESEDKLLEGVLEQINVFVEHYGREEGYDVVLGTTADGNIMYGDAACDITEEVLRELNSAYRGEKQ